MNVAKEHIDAVSDDRGVKGNTCWIAVRRAYAHALERSDQGAERARAAIVLRQSALEIEATGRRRTKVPLVEIARAKTDKEAREGLERWKSRHPEVVPHLEPADVLVDAMRGRSSAWYRIRVNLIHVPAEQRPPPEPLEVDYDPWAAYRGRR